MTDTPLHVVLGTGQVGLALTERLTALGLHVRAVSRGRAAGLPDSVDWRSADLTDTEAARDAVKGASVVYQCLNVPYTRWPELFPPLQAAVVDAVQHAEALLVSLENVYGYGPLAGRPMTEDLPLAATTTKGQVRVAMTRDLQAAYDAGLLRMTIGRASDFFGPRVTESTLGSRVFAHALEGKRVDFIGNPTLLHTYSYVPDMAAGLATLGTDERSVGQVWHLPGPETVTTRAVFDLLATDVRHEVKVRNVAPLMLRAMGLVNPMMRELAEMSYEFDQPFVLDTSKYENTFGAMGTPLATAVADTVAWYRTDASQV